MQKTFAPESSSSWLRSSALLLIDRALVRIIDGRCLVLAWPLCCAVVVGGVVVVGAIGASFAVLVGWVRSRLGANPVASESEQRFEIRAKN